MDNNYKGDVHKWDIPQLDGKLGSIARSALRESTGQPPTAKQVEAIQAAAYKEGFQQGIREGQAKGLEETRQIVASLKGLLRELSEEAKRFDDAMISDIGVAIIAIAKQIIRREITISPEHIIDVIRRSIAVLPSVQDPIVIRMNSHDHSKVGNLLDVEFVHSDVRIIADGTITSGGCIIETKSSRVDSTIEARIGVISAEIFGGQRASDV